MSLYYKTKCAWCGSELVKSEQEALKKESQHICFSCCQSDDENYGTQQHLKEYVCPECNTGDFLMWNFSGDGTTDCGSCACNWEEHELKEKEINVQSNTKEQIQREEDRSKRSSKSDV